MDSVFQALQQFLSGSAEAKSENYFVTLMTINVTFCIFLTGRIILRVICWGGFIIFKIQAVTDQVLLYPGDEIYHVKVGCF